MKTGKLCVVLAVVLLVGGATWWAFAPRTPSTPTATAVPAGIAKASALTPSAPATTTVSPPPPKAPPEAPEAAATPAPAANLPPVKIDRSASGIVTPPPSAVVPAATSDKPVTLAGHVLPFHFAAGPPDGPAIVLKGAKEAGGLRSPNLEVKPPLAIYELHLAAVSQIARGAGLEVADPSRGFLYPIEDSGRFIEAHRIGMSRGSGYRETGGMGGGPATNNADKVVDALYLLADDEKVRTGSFEARVLYVYSYFSNPVIGNGVIWLKNLAGGDDLIFPLPPNNPNFLLLGLDVHQLIAAHEFLEAIRRSVPPNAASL